MGVIEKLLQDHFSSLFIAPCKVSSSWSVNRPSTSVPTGLEMHFNSRDGKTFQQGYSAGSKNVRNYNNSHIFFCTLSKIFFFLSFNS